MSGQLESLHFFQEGDLVQALDGRTGVIMEAWSLYAVVIWTGGLREELDQFDPAVSVLQRAEQA